MNWWIKLKLLLGWVPAYEPRIPGVLQGFVEHTPMPPANPHDRVRIRRYPHEGCVIHPDLEATLLRDAEEIRDLISAEPPTTKVTFSDREGLDKDELAMCIVCATKVRKWLEEEDACSPEVYELTRLVVKLVRMKVALHGQG